MPRLSLYTPNKQDDYRFLDRTISEQLTVGGTDLLIHKYLGPQTGTTSTDFTQPNYSALDPTNIQDLLFMENRDRVYDKNIYRLRGHYSVQNLDFDLSQFGLFLNNDVIFISVHYNDMIDIVGRKLMVGDVLELPHQLDYNPLDDTIPVALKRFYQITDANFASEGYTQTWYPHLWRIKCEPLVNSQEFQDILKEPVNQDNYLGDWNSTTVYPPGYTITFGDKIYESIKEVPAGTTPPNSEYWELVEDANLIDILSNYNKNLIVNDRALAEAKRIVPESGYDTSKLYIVPTFGEYSSNGVLSNQLNQPANPVGVITSSNSGVPIPVDGVVVFMRSPKYKNPSVGIQISQETLDKIWNITGDVSDKLDKFIQASLSLIEVAPQMTDTGSGSVETNKILSIQAMGPVTGPYGTADNTYATSDQNPQASGFTGEITPDMDYLADCDPSYQYIARSSPRSFGYTTGYLTGDGLAPNGFPTGAGISFPLNPNVGDYFLRIDYQPQILYRWNGKIWVRISTDVRTDTGHGPESKSLLSTFINNQGDIYLNSEQKEVPQRQALSTLLQPAPDPVPPTV